MPSLIIPVIPYLISFVSMDMASTLLPWYTFNVEISTVYFDVLTRWESTASVSFDLKCQLVTFNISRCYIPESSIRYTSITDYEFNYEFTPSPVNYSYINFTMEFDDMGVTRLDVENVDVEDINSLKIIYGMIGNQLNIGADIRSKEKTFYEMENSTMGTCRTHYLLSKVHYPYELNYTLKSLTFGSYLEFFQRESVDIRKYRAIEDCCSNCNYILGIILWTDLFLTTDFTVTMTHSASQMLLDKHYFYSATHNLFLLYDEQNYLIGSVKEHIKVTLCTVDA